MASFTLRNPTNSMTNHVLKSSQIWKGFGFSFEIKYYWHFQAYKPYFEYHLCCCCVCPVTNCINMFSLTGMKLILCDRTISLSSFLSELIQLLTFTVHEGGAIWSSQGNVLLSKIIACTAIITVAIFFTYLLCGKIKSQRILTLNISGDDIYVRACIFFLIPVNQSQTNTIKIFQQTITV